jgi:hypothetical protein
MYMQVGFKYLGQLSPTLANCTTILTTYFVRSLYLSLSALSWLLVVLSNVGKFGVTAAFSIIYVYTAELYHTTVRSASIGVCSIGARVFAMASPYIADLVSGPIRLHPL